MGIRLDVPVTEEYPPGDFYLPDVRLRRDPTSEPPSMQMPYTPFLTDAVALVEDTIGDANQRWAMAFPTRSHAGQRSPDRLFGSRGSPLVVPERQGGSLVAVSI